MKRWPDVALLARDLDLPAGVRARVMARADIPRVTQLLGDWYPQLAIAEDHELLTPAFYDEEVALAGEDCTVEARPVFVVLFELEGEPTAFIALEHEAHERALLGRMEVVSPRFRGRGIGRAMIALERSCARALGVLKSYCLVELDNRAPSGALDWTGVVLCGIAPDTERTQVAPGVIRYVPEALYVRSFVPPEEIAWPAPEGMRPRTAALMKLLFDHGEPVPAPAHRGPSPLPEIDPAALAIVAERAEGTWPDAGILAATLDLPRGHTARPLARGDVPRLIARLPAWCPEAVLQGAESRLLDPSFYDEHVALAGEDQSLERRPNLAVVTEHDGELTGFTQAICDVTRSTMEKGLSVIDPRLSDLPLSTALARLHVLLGRAAGVKTLFVWATMRHPRDQLDCERLGYLLAGIAPVSEVLEVAPGVVKHAFAALYLISRVPVAERYRPPRDAMSPRMAALADFVLGAPEEGAR